MTAYWPALFVVLVVAALAWYHTREVAKAYEDGRRDARTEDALKVRDEPLFMRWTYRDTEDDR